MKISVKVKAGTNRRKIEKTEDGSLVIWIKEKPVEGKANEAVAKALAEYFGVSKSRVSLIIGQTSKQKAFEIND